MKLITVSLLLLNAIGLVSATAGPVNTIIYSASCVGQGFNSRKVDIFWTGIFDENHIMDNEGAGQTHFKIVRQDDGKILLDTSGSTQQLFRQTEAGISFFGKYINAKITAENQTVYTMIAYGGLSSIYWYLANIKLYGQTELFDVINELSFRFQAIAEEDPNSTLTLQFKCKFSVN